MKVSQKLEYACRVCIQLAKSGGGERVSRVEDLAQKEAVSSNFLVQILNELRRAGIVHSRRGKLGGYALAKPSQDITLAHIVKAIEGEVLAIDSDEKGDSGLRVSEIWQKVGRHVEDHMQAITLEEMSSEEALLEYYI